MRGSTWIGRPMAKYPTATTTSPMMTATAILTPRPIQCPPSPTLQPAFGFRRLLPQELPGVLRGRRRTCAALVVTSPPPVVRPGCSARCVPKIPDKPTDVSKRRILFFGAFRRPVRAYLPAEARTAGQHLISILKDPAPQYQLTLSRARKGHLPRFVPGHREKCPDEKSEQCNPGAPRKM